MWLAGKSRSARRRDSLSHKHCGKIRENDVSTRVGQVRRGENEGTTHRNWTHIEKTILLFSQVSSSHHPSPESPENRRVGTWSLSHEMPC
jgi:hypothetical protein